MGRVLEEHERRRKNRDRCTRYRERLKDDKQRKARILARKRARTIERKKEDETMLQQPFFVNDRVKYPRWLAG